MLFVSRRMLLVVGLAVAFLTGSAFAQQPADPLPSWNDSAAKKSITDFVARVTADWRTIFPSDGMPVAGR